LQKQIWNVKDILAWTANYFTEKKVDSPRITAELLLGKTLSLSRVNLYLNYDRPLNEDELKKYKSYINRRVSGEPAQYIVGSQEFWSLNFKVTPDVLIPRADTETLVSAVIDDIKERAKDSVKLLEIGTGSGIISVSIAHELKEKLSIEITASDISQNALNIAKGNASANGVDDVVKFIVSDKFNNIDKGEKFDYIVSNPPYISKEFYDDLDKTVKDFEPKLALYGGDDGLIFYREILSLGYDYLKESGKLFFEIDFRKKEELTALIDKNKFTDIAFHKDLARHDRVLELSKKKGTK